VEINSNVGVRLSHNDIKKLKGHHFYDKLKQKTFFFLIVIIKKQNYA